MRPPMSDSSPPLPRFGLAALCLLHAVIFCGAASTLPWRSGSGFAALLTFLAALHAVTAVVALLRKPSWLTWSWRVLSLASLVAFVVLAWSIAAAALYVSKLYLNLGPTVAGGVLGAGAALALLTVPIGVWGALRTWPRRAGTLRRAGAGTLILLLLAILSLPLAGRAAQGQPIALANSEVASNLRDILEEHAQQRSRGKRRSVAGAGPAECEAPVSAERLTLLVAYVHKKGGRRSACLQARSGRQLRKGLTRLLRKSRPGSTVVIDLVKAVKPLDEDFPLLDAFKVRPGIDGVCEEQRCLPAWQLVLVDSFSENRPLPAIRDVSYGFSAETARAALGSSQVNRGLGNDGLLRIEAHSFVASAEGVHQLVRTRTTPPALSPTSVERALAGAQRYIVDAQEGDGTFRYSLDPATGHEDTATLSLPRQAGTTYALCELGQASRVARTVKRALAVFEPAESKHGDISTLGTGGDYGLGKSALPLVSLLRCRELAGAGNDRLIGQLSRLMLEMQRENGSFYPAFDVSSRRGAGDHEVMYGAGQALLALVLLEQRLPQLAGGAAEPLPEPAALRGALDRAMAYYAGPYWRTPLRDFFFFEEGWHCLAARAALTSHRDDAYERFCLDYVASRARWIIRAKDTSEPSFVGGYGLSDLFPPHYAATAGIGEALNAAIDIKLRRGMPVDEDKAVLRDLLTFLLHAQWSQSGCYACAEPAQVIGGFSQQLAASAIRIDYVQHAMAAIGHGAELLGLRRQ